MNNNQRRETNGSPRNTNQEKPETVMTILEDFCGYTTSGGLERVVGTKYIVLKILWVIIFFGALTAAILQLVTLFELYQRKPISTRISLEHSTVCIYQVKNVFLVILFIVGLYVYYVTLVYFSFHVFILIV